jgi:hypothetical protein
MGNGPPMRFRYHSVLTISTILKGSIMESNEESETLPCVTIRLIDWELCFETNVPTRNNYTWCKFLPVYWDQKMGSLDPVTLKVYLFLISYRSRTMNNLLFFSKYFLSNKLMLNGKEIRDSINILTDKNLISSAFTNAEQGLGKLSFDELNSIAPDFSFFL